MMENPDEKNEKNRFFTKKSAVFSENSEDYSKSELSFEGLMGSCEEIREIQEFERSSIKKIKEKFANNDSFYDNMITELNSQKKADFYDDFDKFEGFEEKNEKNEKNEENAKNEKNGKNQKKTEFLMKLQDVSNEKNHDLAINNSFLNHPLRNTENSLRKSKKNVEKIAKNFENYDILSDLKRKLEEKEAEIGKSFNFQANKSKNTFFEIKKTQKNDFLVKNAKKKVEEMFDFSIKFVFFIF